VPFRGIHLLSSCLLPLEIRRFGEQEVHWQTVRFSLGNFMLGGS